MALTSQNMMHQQPSTISKSIARASRESWESIDLKGMQDICGHSLNDSEVKWILLAIDGVHKIKSLKMTNCIGIIGDGLEPLRSSMILQYIDLSLVGDHESPNIDPEPPIDVSVVVPILDSIINTEGNSLVHVQLPKKWRQERSDMLTNFLERFDIAFDRRRIECSKSECDKICQRNENDETELALYGLALYGRFYGINTITCYQCMKKICHSCYDDCVTGFCCTCEKFYCNSCIQVLYCEGGDCSTSYQPSSCVRCNVVKGW